MCVCVSQCEVSLTATYQTLCRVVHSKHACDLPTDPEQLLTNNLLRRLRHTFRLNNNPFCRPTSGGRAHFYMTTTYVAYNYRWPYRQVSQCTNDVRFCDWVCGQLKKNFRQQQQPSPVNCGSAFVVAELSLTSTNMARVPRPAKVRTNFILRSKSPKGSINNNSKKTTQLLKIETPVVDMVLN